MENVIKYNYPVYYAIQIKIQFFYSLFHKHTYTHESNTYFLHTVAYPREILHIVLYKKQINSQRIRLMMRLC